jgi:hypothetical protein
MQQIAPWKPGPASARRPLQPQEVEQLGKFVRAAADRPGRTMLGNDRRAVGNSERVAALASSCTTRTARWAWR